MKLKTCFNRCVFWTLKYSSNMIYHVTRWYPHKNSTQNISKLGHRFDYAGRKNIWRHCPTPAPEIAFIKHEHCREVGSACQYNTQKLFLISLL
jgi:hypothetical protein